jgi:large subunit ribosomal protein L4
MELKVYDIQGRETGANVQLADTVFAIEPNDHAIWLDVKQYLAAQRQGTHKSKQRNEIAGSTKKLKALARRSALTYKAKGEAITVVRGLEFETPKTKAFLAVMNALSLGDKKVLVLVPEANTNVSLSVRNIPNAKVIVARNVNTYELMNAQTLLVAEGSVGILNELLS